MHWHSHIASATEIGMDAQLQIKEGSGGLEYYYDMLSIVLLAGPDKCAGDFRQQHQRAPWRKVNSPFFWGERWKIIRNPAYVASLIFRQIMDGG